jgi:hypothetical protein
VLVGLQAVGPRRRLTGGLRRVAQTRRRVVPALAGAGVALAVVLATHLWDFEARDLRIAALDAGSAWSFSHVLATAAFATGAAVGALGARAGGPRRRSWSAAGALFAFLLVDNVTRLHEHLSGWPLLYAPLIGALSVTMLMIAAGTDLDAVVAIGLALLFVALAIHVFGPALVRAAGWSPHGLAYQVKVGLKEGLELAGWVVVVPAMVRLARAARAAASVG